MATRIDEDITFRKLEVLLAFLEAGSLGRTAERLGTSTVSVYRALHSLEAGVRCTLLRSEDRNLLPNDAALALADVARDVLRLMDEGVRSTRAVADCAADLLQKLRDGGVDTALLGQPEPAARVHTLPLFEYTLFFAVQVGSALAAQAEVDLAACADERFVSLTPGLATSLHSDEAFHLAGFASSVVMSTGDIFSLMNLVGALDPVRAPALSPASPAPG